ncbi:MAG: RNA 2',3'-cyclic phosphodiesterase [Ignavibacteria bacterium]
MRCFISINLDNATLLAVESVKKLLIKTIPSAVKPYIKWEPKDKLHITLLFLGEVKKENLVSVIDRLNTVNIQSLCFTFKKATAFPNTSLARVIILEGTDETGNSYKLYQSICENLQPLGFVPDKTFKPHITLGRIKKVKYISLTNIINTSFIPIRFETKKFALMESELLAEGSKYRLIKEFIQV